MVIFLFLPFVNIACSFLHDFRKFVKSNNLLFVKNKKNLRNITGNNNNNNNNININKKNFYIN